MSINLSALHSLNASLEELLTRLAELSRDAGEDDDIGLELREVERQVHTASRRLAKALHRANQA